MYYWKPKRIHKIRKINIATKNLNRMTLLTYVFIPMNDPYIS